MKTFIIALSLALWASASISAQSAGQIIVPCTSIPNPLDPNMDGWITLTGTPFTAADQEEVEQEVVWLKNFCGPNYFEPDADPSSGGSCGQTDLVENNALDVATACYYRYDPAYAYMIFRIRVASNPSGNFGYVVLIDTDMKYGAGDDPNYIISSNGKLGNPGFEREIRMMTGGSTGLFVDNVDGVLATSSININTYPIATHSQRVLSAGSDYQCPADAIFFDFFVPIGDLGITPTDPIRLIPVTTTNGASALGSTVSDVGGVDDGAYPDIESRIDAAISEQCSNPLLPIELASFNAAIDESAVKLNWSTASEINSDHFVIQRSNGSTEFSDISIVFAGGNSNNTLEYEYTDIILNPEGTYYYRLQMVDLDGTYKYSNIIPVNFDDGEKKVQIYPNPIAPNGLINIQSPDLIKNVIVTDLSGRYYYQTTMLSDTQLMFKDNISPGTYLIVFLFEDGTRSFEKIIIQ